jgi:acetyl-CoA carboxylase carboxyltransferase component
MGPDQLGGVMEQITGISAGRSGRAIEEDSLRDTVDSFKEQVRRDSAVYHMSTNLLDDGDIDPRDTRDVLGMCMEVVKVMPVVGNPGFQGLARL